MIVGPRGPAAGSCRRFRAKKNGARLYLGRVAGARDRLLGSKHSGQLCLIRTVLPEKVTGELKKHAAMLISREPD